MTTSNFRALASHHAQALNTIKTEHCAPPGFKPAQDVRGSIPCPKCRGTLKFSVLASNGASAGRCTTTGCLNWME
jgi:hypothetical protein